MLLLGEKEACLKIKNLPPMSSSHQLLGLVKGMLEDRGARQIYEFSGGNLSITCLMAAMYGCERYLQISQLGAYSNALEKQNRAHRSWSDLIKLSELRHNTRALGAFGTQLAGYE